MTIKKAVFPVAGLGTRFLPATKSVPKEMLTVVDRPVIHYAVQEAIEAGCDTLIFVTGRSKQSIVHYFDSNPELEAELEAKNKTEALDAVRNIIPPHVQCIFVRQHAPLGLGHAVLQAACLIQPDEHFAVLLPDDLIDGSGRGCLKQLSEVYEQEQCSAIALEQVAWENVHQYGVIKPIGDAGGIHPMSIESIVEKPARENAPSNWSVVGRYVLSGKIMDILKNTEKGTGGEIQLTDAIAQLLENEKIMGVPFAGKRFDCGSKAGFIEANMHFGLSVLQKSKQ